MIISGKHLADDRHENYLAASWDRRRPGYFRKESHPPFMRRIWNRRGGYSWGAHADRVWTRWIGRVRIARASA